MKVGYQGVKGAFSEVAINTYFGEGSCEKIGYSDFLTIFEDVQSGALDYGMFPVENTTTGVIARTYDFIQNYDVFAVGEVVVPVRHCLIGIPGAKVEDVKTIYSHPEAILQCNNFFKRNPEIKPVISEDTALSVEYVKSEGKKHKAAIAGAQAAETYGMEIIERNVQDSDSNMTRFLVVSSKEEYPDDADKVSIRMVTAHTPGSLYNALGIFASKNINVLKLESRPIPGKAFDYCFYLDFEGSFKDPDVIEALRRLAYDCRQLDVFGNYKASELAI